MNSRILTILLIGLCMFSMTACDSDMAAKNGTITQAQAEEIALDHAGCSLDEVAYLHTRYEVDDGTPIYDVQFKQGYVEYDYDIHAENGNIISYDRDDD